MFVSTYVNAKVKYPAEKIYEDLRSGWSLSFLLDKKIVSDDI